MKIPNLAQRIVEERLYGLHKRIWSGNEVSRRALKHYETAVDYYESEGFDVESHRHFVRIYRRYTERRGGVR